jgi:hypothetical protein
MNAENVPNVRQSRLVFGLEKLKAKSRKITELTMTSDHKPYAGISWFTSCPPSVPRRRRVDHDSLHDGLDA